MRLDTATIQSVMRTASRQGLDPYNSADRCAVVFAKRMRDRLRHLDAKLSRKI